MMSEFVVTGAGGHVGSAVADALLGRGHQVRVADINTESLAERYGGRAEVAHLDFFDETTFEPVVQGARSVFLLRPPPISSVGDTINPFIDEAIAWGVDHVVFSSVAGAESNSIVPHYRIEQHIFESGVDWTILRPGFFAQNLESAYRTDIVSEDRIYVPADDGVVAFIDARDIGEIAALVMTEEGHRGQAYHLTGGEAVDFYRVCEILSEALGRTISYEPAAVVPYFFHLTHQGLKVAQALVQTILHAGLRRGDGAPVTDTVRQLLGRPPRTLSQYVAERVDLF